MAAGSASHPRTKTSAPSPPLPRATGTHCSQVLRLRTAASTFGAAVPAAARERAASQHRPVHRLWRWRWWGLRHGGSPPRPLHGRRRQSDLIWLRGRTEGDMMDGSVTISNARGERGLAAEFCFGALHWQASLESFEACAPSQHATKEKSEQSNPHTTTHHHDWQLRAPLRAESKRCNLSREPNENENENPATRQEHR